MKVKMDLYSSGEIIAFGKFMADLGAIHAAQEVARPKDIWPDGAVGLIDAADAVAKAAAAEMLAPRAAETPAPKTTKPRSATKKELEEQRASVEATAAADAAARKNPTDPAPQNTAASVGGEVASSSTAEAEPPAITAEEARNQIIDLLNDWSEAKPDDPEIRVKTLGPLLEKLGAAKIGAIDPKKYKLIPGLVDDSRAELVAYKGAATGAEE